DDIRVVLVLPTPAMFGVPEFSAELERVAARYGIEVHTSSEATEIDGAGRRVAVTDHAAGTTSSIEYDFLHAVPPQSAPDWLAATPLAGEGTPEGTPRATRTRCSTSATRTSSLSAVRAPPRTRRPVPPSASRPRCWWRTSPRTSPGRSPLSATAATPPARSRPRGTRCCWPSSTTPCAPPRA